MLSAGASVDRLNLWGDMLFAAEEDVAAGYVILFWAVFSSLIAFFSEVESFVKAVLIAISLLLKRSFWHSWFRIWLWSLFLESNIFSQWLQEDLLHVAIWLWLNNRLIDENEAEQIMHRWYSRGNCGVACGVDLKDSWIGDSLLNMIINVFMHLARSASLRAWLDWYHIYAAPRRHFGSSCTMSASWYWSHEIWFTNMFTSWYRRSFGKSYCSEASKKPISFDVRTCFCPSNGESEPISFRVLFRSCLNLARCLV